MTAREARLQALALDVDVRLMELWRLAWHEDQRLRPVMEDDDQREAFAVFIRAAYAMGYHHALVEDSEGNRGELARAHGYAHS